VSTSALTDKGRIGKQTDGEPDPSELQEYRTQRGQVEFENADDELSQPSSSVLRERPVRKHLEG
jgi:hypothetical protein